MFIRERPIKGTTHVKIQICESIRQGKKVVQKTVRQVGTAKSEAELALFKKTAEAIIHQIEAERQGGLLFDDFETLQSKNKKEEKIQKQKTHVNVEDLKEIERHQEGPIDIFGHAAKELELEKLAPKGHEELLKNLIAARIVQPSSKRRTRDILENKAGFNCSLDSIYRLLSHLGKNEDDVNLAIAKASRKTFDAEIDLMFFDVTTLYFESWDIDELRNFGFSKDCKFGQVQVTLALATEKSGFPVGYKLFPGNTAEISTLIECVESWRELFKLGEVIFVADRGMFSSKNLHAIVQAGCKFIVGCPLRKLSKDVHSTIFESSQYYFEKVQEESFWHTQFEHTLTFRDKLKESQHVSGSLVVAYSSKRAHKDSKDRLEMIEKTKKKYEGKKGTSTNIKEIIGNRGYSKFLEVSNLDNTTISIDQKKIEQEEKWDGYFGIFTNASITSIEAITRYRGLWRIEECFRLSKTHLRIRPVFHFSPERIRGHVALCFLSLATLKYTQYRIEEKTGEKLSADKIIDELKTVETTTMEDKVKKVRFKVPSKMSDLVKKIYRTFKIKRTQSAKVIAQ